MLFRKMRRKKQRLSPADGREVLRRGNSAAVLGDERYLYAVPLSYVYDGIRILFHCGNSGHKLDEIWKNPKVSF